MGAKMGMDLQRQGNCSYALMLLWVSSVHMPESLAELWSIHLQYSPQIDVFGVFILVL